MRMLMIATTLWLAMPGCAAPSDADDDTAVAADELSATPSATTTWRLELDHENCFDVFERACTKTFPSPQCPAGTVAGSPCHVAVGQRCYQTIQPGGGLNSYLCR